MNWPYDRSRRLVAGLDSVSVCMCVSLRVKGKSNYVGFVRPPTLSMLLYALKSTFCVKDFQGFVDIKWPNYAGTQTNTKQRTKEWKTHVTWRYLPFHPMKSYRKAQERVPELQERTIRNAIIR